MKSTAMVNQYYFYRVDEDFRPFFSICSYFPYNANLCIIGHEYHKRQLAKEGIGFEALDNGNFSCEHPERMNSEGGNRFASLRHALCQRQTWSLAMDVKRGDGL